MAAKHPHSGKKFLTKVKLYNDEHSIIYVFQSDNKREYKETFIELEYKLNGLDYNGTDLKDKHGNIIAKLIEIIVDCDEIILPVKGIFDTVGGWLKKLKWW